LIYSLFQGFLSFFQEELRQSPFFPILSFQVPPLPVVRRSHFYFFFSRSYFFSFPDEGAPPAIPWCFFVLFSIFSFLFFLWERSSSVLSPPVSGGYGIVCIDEHALPPALRSRYFDVLSFCAMSVTRFGLFPRLEKCLLLFFCWQIPGQ